MNRFTSEIRIIWILYFLRFWEIRNKIWINKIFSISYDAASIISQLLIKMLVQLQNFSNETECIIAKFKFLYFSDAFLIHISQSFLTKTSSFTAWDSFPAQKCCGTYFSFTSRVLRKIAQKFSTNLLFVAVNKNRRKT